jgi:aryl-alcohol dehydrogenase-like predicted oxidoreductase
VIFVEKRMLGKTGIELSRIGFGGILVTDETPAEAERLVKKAIDAGINYFDVAPSYGNAQKMLGSALKPFRKDVFLACKSQLRDYDGVMREFKESLDLLKTNRINLYQLHAVTTDEDVDQILSSNGALKAFLELKENGVIDFIGFSAHTEAAALRLMENYDFDTVLFPFNWVLWNKTNFGKRVMETAQKKEMGILALKAMAKRALGKDEIKEYSKCWYYPVDSYKEAEAAVRFTLSLPVTAAVMPGHEKFFDWAIKIEKGFEALNEDKKREIYEKAQNYKPIFPED